MGKRKILTITDLAQAARVSASTVSRVLNNSGYVGVATRRRVQDVITAHGFVPSQAARSLATSRTSLIGLIIPNFDNPVYLEVLKGVNAAAIERSYSVVLSQSGEEPGSIRDSLMRLAALRVDGILAASPEVHHVDMAEHLTAFISEKIPVGQLGDANPRWRIDGVNADSRLSGRLAAEHLVRCGHDRITVMGTVVNEHVRRRVEGIRGAIASAGLPARSLSFLDADFTQAGGYRAAREALRGPARPRALIALNDVMAVGTLTAAEECGIPVPRELAVVGIDGIPLGTFVRPTLTTVALPTFEMGQRLFELIHQRICGTYAGEARGIVFPPRLAARQSTVDSASEIEVST